MLSKLLTANVQKIYKSQNDNETVRKFVESKRLTPSCDRLGEFSAKKKESPVASALLFAESRWNKLRGYRHLPVLNNAPAAFRLRLGKAALASAA
jgi:hypothetical protein